VTRKKREEARLLSYALLFNKQGQLITERTSTDITKLQDQLTKEDFNTLQTTVRTAARELDEVHSKIEADLNSRKS
jgi:hypothetical protein|tara:strand:+ start:1325 stop:1552 length:228 start_codon:yes stop_codon:yes gene_type:complete